MPFITEPISKDELSTSVYFQPPSIHRAGDGSILTERFPFLFPVHLLRESCPVVDDPGADDHDRPDVPQIDDLLPQDSMQWILVHTKSRQEKKLAEELRRIQIAHFLPATRFKALTRGRTRYTWVPLFPGYLFLKCNTEQRLQVLKTNRVVATHSVTDQTSLSKQLCELVDLIEKGVPLRVEERLVAGQMVRVKSGPLKDHCGTIIKRGGKTRLFINVIDLLGGVSIEVEHHQIESA